MSRAAAHDTIPFSTVPIVCIQQRPACPVTSSVNVNGQRAVTVLIKTQSPRKNRSKYCYQSCPYGSELVHDRSIRTPYQTVAVRVH